ncbi:MAG: tetratricopeptide repeat protein, partial [bacterium]|nr:tetratricopeptide repeat protein [bacterium]
MSRRAALVALLGVQLASGVPDSAELKTQGAALFEESRYLESAIAYKRADRITPLDNRSRFTLVAAFMALERGHWARPELERLIASEPLNPVYPYWLAGVYYSYNWFDEAVAELNKSLALDPAFAAAYDRLGLCLEGLGKDAEALKEYETAIRLNIESGQSVHWPAYHL